MGSCHTGQRSGVNAATRDFLQLILRVGHLDLVFKYLEKTKADKGLYYI
jgi:hypothetical protein